MKNEYEIITDTGNKNLDKNIDFIVNFQKSILLALLDKGTLNLMQYKQAMEKVYKKHPKP